MNDELAPRAARKESTRKTVLAAARAELERVGYEATSIRGIAKLAGVSAGTVLHHCADKRDLLHTVLFADLEATLGRALEELLAEAPAALLEKRLHRLSVRVFGFYSQRPGLSRSLLKESLFADPPWSERFAAQAARVHVALVTAVENAAARGELPRPVSAPLLGSVYLSFFYFALIGWVQGALADPVALVDAQLHQHLAAAGPEKTVSKRRMR